MTGSLAERPGSKNCADARALMELVPKWVTNAAVPANDRIVRYIYGPDGTVTADTTTMTATGTETIRWYHHDQHGSTRMLTDRTGGSVATYSYTSVGDTGAGTGAATTPIGWAGEYRDIETGFVYLRARYYDPTTAQFLTRDPAEAITRSAYGYAGNNPINNTDPTGLFCVGDLCTDGVTDALGGAASWIADDPGRALTYAAIGLGGAALIIGTAGLAAPGLTVLGASAGTVATGLSAGSTLASFGVAAIDCYHDWSSASCAASSAEALGGAVTLGLGGAAVTVGRRGVRMASGVLGFVFDLAALRSPEEC